MSESTYNKNCGLSKFEWQCDNIADRIIKEKSSLLRIGILREFVEAHTKEKEDTFTREEVIDFVNWYIRLHELDFKYTLENETLLDDFKGYSVSGSCLDCDWQDDITNAIVSCPECGCDYTYEVGYGFRECSECLNTWKHSYLLKQANERLNEQEFYEKMQWYRFVDTTNQEEVVKAFEDVKQWIRDNYA